jgi:hypothetical protein
MNRATVILALTLPVVRAAPLAAQWPADLKVSGFAEASYVGATNAAGDVIVGRLYDRFHDQFTLNAFALTLDKAHDAAKRSAGFHMEVLFGQNAAVVQSGGLNLGSQGDIPQLYATLNLPTANGHGVQIKFGRVPTLLGLEVIEATLNPNWSEGLQFIYVENFTNTGLSVETKLSPKVDMQLRIFNGWDMVRDNNRGKSLMGRVGLYPDANSSLSLLAFYGPEQGGNGEATRAGGEVLAWRKLGKGQLWLQGDVGREEQNAALADPTQDASWWALGAWFTYDLTPTVSAAIRGDYLNDGNGARTSGVLGFPANTGHDLSSLTATLNIRTWPGALVRPELRYDHSSLASFGGEASQISVALAVAYLF